MDRLTKWMRNHLWPDYNDAWRIWLSFSAGLTAAIAGLITVVGLIREPDPKGTPWARVALVLWTVIPPAYFWFEYFVMWKPTRAISLEEIKYDQEVCRNIWLAFVVLIAALYFK